MRAYNFCPGPAMIPTEVLEQLKAELLDWHNTGAAVFEISHRSKDFIENVLEPAEANLRQLLHIPKNYHVLFTSLGSSHHFAMAPLNLLDRHKNNTACYIDSGIWSRKAIKEAERYGNIQIAGVDSSFNTDFSYIHYTPNETIEGFQLHDIPQAGEVPLIADMTSEILSKPIDIPRYGLIYAGAQKNIGPSGLSIAILRDDLVDFAKPFTPTLYNYKTYVDSQSLYHTPNTFGIYLANLSFEWLLKQGGVESIATVNQRKAQKLYDYIDSADFYKNTVDKRYRSIMNVVFYTPKPEWDAVFIEEATKHQLINLKGHKVVGGIRASIYNAMPEAGVDALIHFMKDFEKRHA